MTSNHGDPLTRAYEKINELTTLLMRTWMHVHDGQHTEAMALCQEQICIDIRKVIMPL